MRKIVFASVVILMLSLLTMLHVVEVVDANAFPRSFKGGTGQRTVQFHVKEDASYSGGPINWYASEQRVLPV